MMQALLRYQMHKAESDLTPWTLADYRYPTVGHSRVQKLPVRIRNYASPALVCCNWH